MSKQEIKTKAAIIAELASYGLQWTESNDPKTEQPYIAGGVETVGHQIACCISQWFTHDSEGTAETIDALKLFEFPDRKLLERRLVRYLVKILNPPV